VRSQSRPRAMTENKLKVTAIDDEEVTRYLVAARIMSKSDLSGSALAGAISDALGGLPLEAGARG
jgi:hypothetical protein